MYCENGDDDRSRRTLPVAALCLRNLRSHGTCGHRMYNQELRERSRADTIHLADGVEPHRGNHSGNLGKLLALDTTSLTRMLKPLTKRGWIGVKTGDDRRQRLLRTHSVRPQKLEQSRPTGNMHRDDAARLR